LRWDVLHDAQQHLPVVGFGAGQREALEQAERHDQVPQALNPA
jgi:hypothetical protein